MNFVRQRLVARKAERRDQRNCAEPTGISFRRWLLMLLMIGLIIEVAIRFIKFYF